MKERIFEYQSYKAYLADSIASGPGRGRGMKSALAKAAHCQTTYVSRVLQGTAHFSLEQAELINLHLGHSTDESRYFLLLVEFERAGHPALKKRLREQVVEAQERYQNLKDRFKIRSTQKEMSLAVQAQYYRSWHYSAIHIALTIPQLRTKEALAASLGLPLPIVTEALEFLSQAGLAQQDGQEFRAGISTAFVGRDSPLLTHHHINWRHQAIRSIELNRKEDVHYSSAISIATEDVSKIRHLLLRSIEEARKHWVHAEREEELHAVCLDFFRLNGA